MISVSALPHAEAYATPPESQRARSVPITGSEHGHSTGEGSGRNICSASDASDASECGSPPRLQPLQGTAQNGEAGDLAAGVDAEALLALAHQLCRSLQLEPTSMRVHIETSRTSSGVPQLPLR